MYWDDLKQSLDEGSSVRVRHIVQFVGVRHTNR